MRSWAILIPILAGSVVFAKQPEPVSRRVGEKKTEQKRKLTMAGDFTIELPAEKRPFPEPLGEGQSPGFAWRGTKGWLWTPDQYLEEIPVLAKYKMNFLMNCYGSMCDIEHYRWGNPKCNRWWEPLPEKKRKAFEKIVMECQKRHIQFCFSMNPNLTSERPFDYSNPRDFEALWKQYAWMQGLGVKWFNVSLDDITKGIDASGQARMVSTLYERLRKNDPEAKFIFCPTHYWGTGKKDPYLETLARELDPDVYVFWTGDGVVGPITKSAALSYRKAVGHRLFLWDNYPVNDGKPTLHLGPVTGRDPDLCEVVDGYMSNPMHLQNEINRIPLLTCADYAYNPRAYDPARSIGQAIVHLASNGEQQRALRDLVELYPGFILCGHPDTGWNPVRMRFTGILAGKNAKVMAKAFLEHVESVNARMGELFPDRFGPARRTVEEDIDAMRTRFVERFGKKGGV